MNERGKRQASSLFGGMGFYIALLCCVLAAGVVGYFALLNDTTPTDDPAQTADAADPGPTQSVSGDGGATSIPVRPSRDAADSAPSTQTPQSHTSTQPLGSEPDAGLDAAGSVPTMGQTPVAVGDSMTVTSPLAGETVTVFSIDQLVYDTTMGDWRTHDGIDIQAAAGEPVAAAADGVVLSVEEDGRLGTVVTIDHQNGYVTTYASLQPEVQVVAGDAVDAGMTIGTVGNTSLTEAALGAHLHFSVAKDGEIVDPGQSLDQ